MADSPPPGSGAGSLGKDDYPLPDPGISPRYFWRYLEEMWKEMNKPPSIVKGYMRRVRPRVAQELAQEIRIRGGRNTAELGGVRHPGTGGGRTGSSLASLNSNSYRLFTRAEIIRLEKQLKQAAAALKNANSMSSQTKHEIEKLTKIVEEYASMLKGEIQNQYAAMNLSTEEVSQLKIMVDELKDALKNAPKGTKWYNLNAIQQRARVPRTCGQLALDLGFYAVVVGGVLVSLGYIKLEDPAPFNPRETRAGKLLYDDFSFGMRVNSTYCASVNTTISSLLAGELDSHHSEIFVRRIEESWRCQLAIAPGRDIVLKGVLDDAWFKGLKVDFNLPIYDGVHRKVGISQKHPFGTAGGAIGINANPLLSLNAMFGTKVVSGGCLLDFDTVPGIVKRVALGGVLNLLGVSASLMMEKLFLPQQPQPRHQFSSTFHFQASESTSLGVELIHQMDNNLTTIQAGVEHSVFDSGVKVKCKITNQFVLTGMMQHKLGEKSHISLCAQVDLRDRLRNPRVGISITIEP